MAQKQASTQARAASCIRRELKDAYPYTKFSVTSEGFAGGDAVRIDWTDGPTTNEVDKIVGKYQYGSFDGSCDLYSYTNTRKDIPQAKYVQTSRSQSRQSFLDVMHFVNKRFGWMMKPHEDYNGITRETDFHTGNGWQSHEIHRAYVDHSMVCPICKMPVEFLDKFCPENGHSLTESGIPDCFVVQSLDEVIANNPYGFK